MELDANGMIKGFGGANVHAILESYAAPNAVPPLETPFSLCVLPFVFSASSQKTLYELLERYVKFLDANPNINMLDLAYVLLSRRTTFEHKVHITASSATELKERLKERVTQRLEPGPGSHIEGRPLSSRSPIILGIFTGQGAQWPQMGLDLIMACPKACAWMEEMQESLDSLSVNDRPDFNLMKELSAPEQTSRLNEAAISQPLRTAIQIVQVNFLRSIGVSFAAVVGHSSGEIAAAYAAGVLNARDAIRVAYLRGRTIQYAGHNGQSGAMIAASLSWKQAEKICGSNPWQGKVKIAAYNSPSSVTLSGDHEAITELQWLLQSLGRSARLLHVDVAYHSHHVLPCAQPYREALERCIVYARKPVGQRWFSSVYGGREIAVSQDDGVEGEYWVNNMLSSVGFSQALMVALDQLQEGLDCIMEVGPHPALQGSVKEVISSMSLESNVPYIGVARRAKGSIEALAGAIGSIWSRSGPQGLDVGRYLDLFGAKNSIRLLKDLPLYPFDHSEKYWVESRVSQARRLNREPFNVLLGTLSPDSSTDEWRWKNYLRKDEIPWLAGYAVDGKNLLSPMTYVAFMYEAGRILCRHSVADLQGFEIHDLAVHCAVPILDTHAGLETHFRVDNLQQKDHCIEGTFRCQSVHDSQLRTTATGRFSITMGSGDWELLDSPLRPLNSLRSVSVDEFYKELQRAGHSSSVDYRLLHSLSRQRNAAIATLEPRRDDDQAMLHPPVLESIVQVLVAAIGPPRTVFAPSRIRHLAFSPTAAPTKTLSVEGLVDGSAPGKFQGDLTVVNAVREVILQLDGILMVRETENPPSTGEEPLFTKEVWAPREPNAAMGGSRCISQLSAEVEGFERLVLLGLKRMASSFSNQPRNQRHPQSSPFLEWANNVLREVGMNGHSTLPSNALEEPYAGGQPKQNSRLIEWMAMGIDKRFQGQSTNSIRVNIDNLPGLSTTVKRLTSVVGQLVFLNPHMKIFEHSEGISGISEKIRQEIANACLSYTGPDSVENEVDASSRKAIWSQSFDPSEEDSKQQRHEFHVYDLVIISNAMYSTNSLEKTLIRIHQMLKPGGRLVMMEATNPDSLGLQFLAGSDWWRDEILSPERGPVRDRKEWNVLLKENGFTGIETASPSHEAAQLGMSVMVTRAANNHTNLLDNPLCSSSAYTDLAVVGQMTPVMKSIIAQLKAYFSNVTHVADFEQFKIDNERKSHVLVLDTSDLGILGSKGVAALSGLSQQIQSTLLWVTDCSTARDTDCALAKGFLRALAQDLPVMRIQHLEIPNLSTDDVDAIAISFMRLVHEAVLSEPEPASMAYVPETELRLVNGVFNVPRLIEDKRLNARLMAKDKRLYDVVDVQDVMLQSSGFKTGLNSLHLTKCTSVSSMGRSKLTVDISAEYVSLHAINVGHKYYLHVVIGLDQYSKRRVLALSTVNAARISVPSQWCWEIPKSITISLDSNFLALVISVLMAQQILDQICPGTSLLICDPDPTLFLVLRAMATRVQTEVFGITSQEVSLPGMVCVPKGATARLAKRMIPANVTAFMDSNGAGNDTFVAQIGSLLPGSVDRISWGICQRRSAHKYETLAPSVLSAVPSAMTLAHVLLGSKKQYTQPSYPPSLLDLTVPHDPLTIIDWSRPGQVQAQIQPASSEVKLSATKTYILAFLPTALARYTCEWLIERGARHIVLGASQDELQLDNAWAAELKAHVIPITM